MGVHKNARLTPIGRERLVMTLLSGQTPVATLREADFDLQADDKQLRRVEE